MGTFGILSFKLLFVSFVGTKCEVSYATIQSNLPINTSNSSHICSIKNVASQHGIHYKAFESYNMKGCILVVFGLKPCHKEKDRASLTLKEEHHTILA